MNRSVNLALLCAIIWIGVGIDCDSQSATTVKPLQSAEDSVKCERGDDDKKEYCRSETKPKSSNCASYPFPESEEGPFFLENQPMRSDITENKPGIPLILKLKLTIGDGIDCKPLKNASVHLWHPDALGVYSAYLGYYPLGQPGSKRITGAHAEPTDDSSFLRGIQITDDNGEVNFKTIYPGWYLFRSLHMHFKIFYEGKPKLTGEFYFIDDITDKVAKVEPYSKNDQKRVLNPQDWQYEHHMGAKSILKLEGSVEEGFRSDTLIGLQ